MGATAIGAGSILSGIAGLYGANSQSNAQDANQKMAQQQLDLMRTAVTGYLGRPGAQNPYSQAMTQFVGQQGNIPAQQLLTNVMAAQSPQPGGGGGGYGGGPTGTGGGSTGAGGNSGGGDGSGGIGGGPWGQGGIAESFSPGGGGGGQIGDWGGFGGGIGGPGTGGGGGGGGPTGGGPSGSPGGGMYSYNSPNNNAFMYNPTYPGYAPQVGAQQIGQSWAQAAQSGGFNPFQPGQVNSGSGVFAPGASIPGFMSAPTINNPGTLFSPQMSAAQSPWLQPFRPGQANAGIVQAPQATIPNMYTPPMLGQLPQVQSQQVGTGLGGWQVPGSQQQMFGTQYPSYSPPQAPPAFQNWFTSQLTSPNTTPGMNTGASTPSQNGRIPGAQYSADGTLTALPSGKGWGQDSEFYQKPLAGFQSALAAQGDTAHFFLTDADWQAVQGVSPDLYGKMQQANQNYFSKMSQSDVDALKAQGNDPLIYQTAVAARQAAAAQQTQQGAYTQSNSPIASLVLAALGSKK